MSEKDILKKIDQMAKDIENIKNAVKAWCKILEQNYDELESEAAAIDYYGTTLKELKQSAAPKPDMDMSKDGWN